MRFRIGVDEWLAHRASQLQFYRARFRQEGLIWLVTRIIKRLATIVGWLVLLPIAVLLHAAGFRRVTVFTDRIGHLAAESDCFLKEKALGKLPRRRWFILAPPHRIANAHLLKYWKQHIRIITTPLPTLVLGLMSRWVWMRFDISDYILQLNKTQKIYQTNAEWASRQPILKLTPEDEVWGQSALKAIGVPEGDWFVCVHVREAGFSPKDEIIHAHRNGSVDALLPAIHEITHRGGWCIRMGDPSTTPLPAMPKVIDYAYHALKSDRFDVILCAKARLFLGNTSGIAFVSSVFGVPSALVNMIPASTLALLPGDLSIPKLLWLERESRYLRFDEVLTSPVGNYRYANLYAKAGIKPEENSAQEILDLVRELLDRLDGCHSETGEERERQKRYLSLFRPGHYSYGAASHVGAAFLGGHEDLFPATSLRKPEADAQVDK